MFTSLTDPDIETALAGHMRLIVADITRVFGSNCTIILAGSFGRGEGSVRVERGKNPIPLNDYDVYVITDEKVDQKIHTEMEERILKDLSQLTGSDLVNDKFVVGVEVVPRDSLPRLLPDISTYEMKTASQILYGPDVRNLIPVTSKDIALGSGAITLFHRTIALLENVEPEHLAEKNYPEETRLETVRETCKVYTEICTSLSLIGGFYKPSYKERALDFEKQYPMFPELARIIPDLPRKVSERTAMKIRSDFSRIIDRAPEMWLEARRDLDVCQRYFLSRMLGINFRQPWTNFNREAEKKLKSIFFYDYLSFLLGRRGVRGSPFVCGANIVFQAYDSYSFNRRLRRFGRIPVRELFSLNSPLQNIYLATASVLYSMRDNGTIDQELLETGWNYLGKVFRIGVHGMGPEGWRKARDKCLEAQKLYFIREQKRGL
jgi:hypothetical protein